MFSKSKQPAGKHKPASYETLYETLNLMLSEGADLFLDKDQVKAIPKDEKAFRKAVKKYLKARKKLINQAKFAAGGRKVNEVAFEEEWKNQPSNGRIPPSFFSKISKGLK